MKHREKIEKAIRKTCEGLFEDEIKMDFILSQGGFEKYFQTEIANGLRVMGDDVNVEGVERVDIVINKNSKPSAVIEIGAGFLSQKHQTYKPGLDWKKFQEKKAGNNSDLRRSEYYSLMLLAYGNRKDSFPSNRKPNYALIDFFEINDARWKNLGFKKLMSKEYLGRGLGLSVTLLSPCDKG